jgi:predicted transcriptional regulator
MEVTTVRLPSNLVETLEEAANQRDVSQSAVIRAALRDHFGATSEDGGTSPDRLAMLESRLEALEKDGNHGRRESDLKNHGEAEPAPAQPKTSEAAGPYRGEILAAVNIPNTKDPEECLAAVYQALDFIEANSPASMRDIVTAVMPEVPLGYPVPTLSEGDRYRGAWWRKIVRPGIRAHPAVDYRPNYGDYRLEWDH